MKSTHFAVLCFTTLAAAALAGCDGDINVHPEPKASPLVGSWQWLPDVSHIDIDGDLNAVQTSVFDTAGASPSHYTISPMNDNELVLEGWFANAPCQGGAACDEERAFERHRMSYFVDDQHFMPFALMRLTGKPGATDAEGAGSFEGFMVNETRWDAGPEGEPLLTSETRWRVDLAADGTWTSETETTSTDPVADDDVSASGSWVLDAEGNLSLVDADTGEVTHTLWQGDALDLDGLMFTRQ